VANGWLQGQKQLVGICSLDKS